MDVPDEIYTHGHHPAVVTAHASRTAREAAAFVLPRVEAGMRIIDIGCGPGSITQGLAELVGSMGSVVGIDNSPDVIEVATNQTEPTAGLRFQTGSVYDLPFPDASFDLGYGHQVLQHLADPIAALIELRRVLKQGGIVAMRDADYGTMTHYPPEPAIDNWLDVYHHVARANGGEPDAGRHLAEWVELAGFTNPQVTSSTWTYGAPDARTAWANLWADRITQSALGHRAVELGIVDQPGLATMAAGWRHWAKQSNGWFAFIHGEIVAEKPVD